MTKKQVGGDIDKTTAMMLEIYGYSVEKVAEVWGVSPQTVKRRIKAIKDKGIKQHIKEQIEASKKKKEIKCVKEMLETYKIAIKKDKSNINKIIDLISLECFNKSKCNGEVRHLIEAMIIEAED